MENIFDGGISKIKSKARLGIFTVATLLGLAGCSGSDGGDIVEPFVGGNTLKVKVQAGVVQGANVEIKTISGVFLTAYTSDIDGYIYIEKDKIEGLLDELGLDKNSKLELVATGGVDLDPDDDGDIDNDTDKDIYGTMVSISSLENIANSYITPLSTLVVEILKKDSEYLDSNIDEKLNSIISSLGAKDINNDGKVDIKDISSYDMVSFDSDLEKSIRNNGFLDYIHSGDDDLKNKYINNVLGDITSNGSEIGEQIRNTESFNISFSSSYKPLEILDVEGFETKKQDLKEAILEIDSNITQINSDINSSIGNQNTIKSQISQAETNIQDYYNTLDVNSKALLNSDKTTTEKYNQTANIIGDTTNNTLVLRSISRSVSNVLLPNSNDVEEGKNALITRADNLLLEIEPLKTEMENKEVIYNDKYKEYLTEKELYEDDQKEFKYWNNRYKEYKNKYIELDSDYKLYLAKKNLASDNYLKELELFPSASDYSIATYKNSDYINKLITIKQYNFNYRGNSIEIAFKYSSKGGYSGRLYIKYEAGNSILSKTINNGQHIIDIADLMINYAKYKIDYKYYRDLYNEIKDSGNLTSYAAIRDEAEPERLLYGLLVFIGKDFYEDSEKEYLDAQDDYNNANSALQVKLDKLDEVKQKLETYGIKLGDLTSYENDLTVSKTNYSTLITQLPILSGSKENKEIELEEMEATNPITENENQINEKIEQVITIYTSNGTSFGTDNSNIFRENTIKSYPNTIDYDKYPFTIYVKLNRIGTGEDYPALIWIEFGDQFIAPTERYEVFSKTELNYTGSDGVVSILENKARALIDLNRGLLNKTISITNEQLENKKNEYLIEGLLNNYIAGDTLFIEDGINDNMEILIINALESISNGESVLPYLEELKKHGASEDLLERVKYLSEKMIYGEGQVDMTDEVLMFTGLAGIVKGGIKYIISKSTGKLLIKLSYGEAAREIGKISYKITLFDISKYAGLKMKDIKNINPELYKRIINGKVSLKTSNGIKFKLKDRNAINQHIKGSINYRDDKSYFLTKDFDEVIDLHIESMGKVSKNQWSNFNGKGIVARVDMGRIIGIDVKNGNVQTKFMRIVRTIEGKIHLFPIK